jgi:hypothetical protein
MNKNLLSAVLLLVALQMQAQGLPRLFLDAPSVYLIAPNAEAVGDRMGAGMEVAMNVGTHWSVARLGGGLTFTMDPSSNDLSSTFQTTPYTLVEVGAGMYRSNGNQCAKTKANAFTAMGKAGVRYDFYTGSFRTITDKPGYLDYTVGAEFGYFYIRDIFRNMELLASANYHTKAKIVSATFGFKVFLNLKADRDR